MLILWRQSMAIDNSIIDHIHQVLLSIINDFDEAISSVGGNTEFRDHNKGIAEVLAVASYDISN